MVNPTFDSHVSAHEVTVDFLKRLPKCEAHLHIEGTLTPELLLSLAHKNNVTLPSTYSLPVLLERHLHFVSLQDFLDAYYVSMNVLIDASDFEKLGWNYYLRAHADGVAHAEVFVDPQAHLVRGISLDTVLSGLLAASRKAKTELGISGSIVTCFMRDRSPAEALDVLTQLETGGWFARGDVIGIGLDSAERPFPPALFTQVYAKARSLGCRLTAHAGEEGPPGFVLDALDLLGCERIDHGIRSVEDETVLERLARDRIPLTVCPLSNLALRCVTNVADLPLRIFLERGIVWSINGDDPAYFSGWLLDNYLAVHEAFNFSKQEWRTIGLNAVEGSWASVERKSELRTLIEQVVLQH